MSKRLPTQAAVAPVRRPSGERGRDDGQCPLGVGHRVDEQAAVVEFGDRVRAKTLLAGGQSGDPDSPHFDDQAARYVDRQFKDVAYYREDVERRATRTYHPGG